MVELRARKHGPLWLAAALLAVGCDRAESAARDGIGRAASAAADKSRTMADSAASAAQGKLEELGDEAAAYVDGKLRDLLKGAADGSLEGRLRGGKSSALEVVRIARAVRGSVSGDTTLLPIYRPATDQAAIDREIGEMPRTEVIDGVTVGFKQVRQLDVHQHATDDAYLVLWRRDDKLLGFVYQKNTHIDIDALVRETPKLMLLMRG